MSAWHSYGPSYYAATPYPPEVSYAAEPYYPVSYPSHHYPAASYSEPHYAGYSYPPPTYESYYGGRPAEERHYDNGRYDRSHAHRPQTHAPEPAPHYASYEDSAPTQPRPPQAIGSTHRPPPRAAENFHSTGSPDRNSDSPRRAPSRYAESVSRRSSLPLVPQSNRMARLEPLTFKNLKKHDPRKVYGGPASVRSYRSSGGESSATLVAKPRGKKLALVVGVETTRERAVTTSAQHMVDFLRRYNFAVEQVLEDKRHSNRVLDTAMRMVEEILSAVLPGDSVVLYAISLESGVVDDLVRRLSDGLPAGTRLTVICDCCFLRVRPAYTMDVRVPKKRGFRRLAQQTGPADPVHPDVFLYFGDHTRGGVAHYKTQEGHCSVFTSAFIKAFTANDYNGVYRTPATFAQIYAAIEAACMHILKRLPYEAMSTLHTGITCSGPFDIDQPAFL
eukprot:TRINITY_DN80842_c0_g1_i1.p1 TRINITY_DN80842_c0_g1~~TRINITY_DN80842_c0_g1_i1.p1  ORF type:complete len:461 (-),score=48.33 TRINITY_DN80842_c0_g1_i1:154-1494(-)